MQVHFQTESLPPFRNAVLTIGTFDGVHQGHQQIIAALKKEATAVGGETVIITFHPHPRKIVYPGVPLQLINTLEEKVALLQAQGVDHLVVVPFNQDFASLSAEEYITDFLIRRFHPHTIIIGYDHHFGRGRKGNFKLLEEKAPLFHYQLVEIPQHLLDAIEISSTKIRHALLGSEVETANKALGYPFFFTGTVVHGDKLGRTLGYPTANLVYNDEDKIHLGEGVYAVTATIENAVYKGMLSIGTRPTVNDTIEKVEVNLFDFDREIYGQTLQVSVHHYLRPQERYASLEALTAQIDQDKRDSVRMLENL
ncbi:bifunctional riboflavin kinase/FAD synthetase [Paracnuella aquatica]|uniref:bifunctional riboflavin kinase/FAD synthetase n=1 Tax=Paracnuella aquatica TaxID=2268757 RepID=UPI000DEFDDB0|nr:bifunctional riboflavin kinase/FAD synthetase [Paracnuella aquatica]RPD51126.1 bifunctional riboflavin kinase/FAD synthetase [Paracnuella aquatica]